MRLFRDNRERLVKLMRPNSLAIVNSNDTLPSNADGTLEFRQNSDLFYLTGIEQEQTRLLLCPDAPDEKMRAILFLRLSNPLLETWEGHKLTKEEARKISGIERVEWLSDFDAIFHRLMCEVEGVYLNSNEHARAAIEVETRDARFVSETVRRYPLHEYHRLARLMARLRVVKSPVEVDLLREACGMTAKGFRRVLRFVRPGVNEMEIEAEFAHEFIRHGGRFAYNPIIASGKNAAVLHYLSNDQVCRQGELVLIDVGAARANYNSDMTRTIPVSGKFSRRQRQVYNAVLRVVRGTIRGAMPGKLYRDWQKEAEQMIERELVDLGLLKPSAIKKQDPGWPAFKEFFMHGIGHPLGLDVHDLGFMSEPIQAGWVLTAEPGIYLPKEGMAVRLENNILVTENGPVDLMESIPIEVDEIESIMGRRTRK